jgi:hypothetical protein
MENDNPWISVDDEMPPKGECVRVWLYKVNIPCTEDHDFLSFDEGRRWNFYQPHEVTHWQRIKGPEPKADPVMVEAPSEENIYIADRDPHDMEIGAAYLKDDKKIIWWNNVNQLRLWFWANEKWHRAI